MLLSVQLLETPRTYLLHQLQRMRQEGQEQEVSAALQSAPKAETAEGQEESQPSGDDGDPMVPGKMVATYKSESVAIVLHASKR